MVIGRATAAQAAAALLLLLAGACGGDSADSPSPTPSRSPAPTPSPGASPSTSPTADSEPPEADLIDLARRYRGLLENAPRLARDAPFGYQTGDHEDFEVLDLSGPAVRTVGASVRYVTDHAYFFVEDGTSVSQGTLERIGADFEQIVYPTVRSHFGSEWTPGVDSDPRITLLHASLSGAGGYFSGGDEFPAAMVPRSNEREVLYIDSGVLSSPGVPYNGLLAHEFQHMVQWQADASEDSWVNEGLSQVAAEDVGGGSNWLDVFLADPDTQLTFWPEIESSAVHYAAAELFMSYVVDRFGGRESASQLVGQKRDSIAGVQAYLDAFGAQFADVFADWTVANYLDADSGPYSHASIDATTHIATSVGGGGSGDGDVGQFAADYLEVEAGAGSVLTFDGAEEVSVGVPPLDGSFWWANRGDRIDTRLTRGFDLSGLTTATLRFSAWFDIERGWDYAYVAASTDGGKTWASLAGQQTTDYNPVFAAYGPGYTGQSDGWVQEEIDLSAYAGREVLLRFEYVTDDSTSLTGFAVDNIEIPQLGFSDGDDASGEWTAEGFMRMERPLAQRFIVQVIRDGGVTRVPLDASNRAEIRLDAPATVVVSGVTEGTAEKARYTWSLSP